jgi:hypothetical protein
MAAERPVAVALWPRLDPLSQQLYREDCDIQGLHVKFFFVSIFAKPDPL